MTQQRVAEARVWYAMHARIQRMAAQALVSVQLARLIASHNPQERCRSQSDSVPSSQPAARVRPSGLHAQVRTRCAFSSVATQLAVSASHSLSVSSPLPDAMMRPSGLQEQDKTVLVCPRRVAVQLNGAAADHCFSVYNRRWQSRTFFHLGSRMSSTTSDSSRSFACSRARSVSEAMSAPWAVRRRRADERC